MINQILGQRKSDSKTQVLWKFGWFERLGRLYGDCCDLKMGGSDAVIRFQMGRLSQMGQLGQMVQLLMSGSDGSDGSAESDGSDS